MDGWRALRHPDHSRRAIALATAKGRRQGRCATISLDEKGKGSGFRSPSREQALSVPRVLNDLPKYEHRSNSFPGLSSCGTPFRSSVPATLFCGGKLVITRVLLR